MIVFYENETFPKGDKMRKTITIKDVAREAGVSVGTVSRVINQHPSVKPATRSAVLSAIDLLDYNPDIIARSLKSRSTKSVGVMIPDISSMFYPEILRGIEDVASIYKYNIILCNTDLDRKKEKATFNMLKSKKVDGIIFISNVIDEDLKREFKKSAIPVVLVSTRDAADEFCCVTIDNKRAAYAAASLLCRLGHETIAMIAGVENDPNAGIPRVEGFKQALLDHGIEAKEELIFFGDYKYRSGYEIMKRMIDLQPMPTALFAASDSMAVGAASAALASGLRIPEDLSIIGFDGLEAAEFFYPPISTIKQPRYEMGAGGMEQLIRLLNHEEIEEPAQILDFMLIERRSTCKHTKRF